MDLLILGRIEFTMLHACAGTHALHAAWANDGAGTHTVPVCERSFQHITDNLHITVAVAAKTTARLDGIIIDDAQRAQLDMFGIMVIRKGKAVPGIQPAVISMTPVLSAA